MEEEKILEEMLNKMKKNNFIIQYKDLYIDEKNINAIENLLKRYKELEEENKILIIAKAEALQEMRKYKAKYENLKIRHNGTKEALRVAEDLEKQYSQEASNLEAELDNSIPISVIQNKIDELREKEKTYYFNNQGYSLSMVQNKIIVLQELLEERSK